MPKEIPNNTFIYCPNCEGQGKNKPGLSCSNCQGVGLGTFFHNRFFYWGPRLGRAVIELSHLREKAQLSINFATFALGLLGLLSLAAWVYLATQHTVELGAFAFWREKHILILLFWLSLVADMFVYYRLSEESRQKHKIKRLVYEERQRKENIANNWDELARAKNKFKIDVSGGYSPQAMKIVEDAYLVANKLDHKYVTPMHLFYASLSDKQVGAIFSRLNVDAKVLFDKLKAQISAYPTSEGKTEISRRLKELLINAYINSYQLGQKKVTAKNLIIPAMEADKMLTEILFELEVSREKIFNVILWFIINEKQVAAYKKYKQMARFKPSTNMDRAYTSVATPTLNQLGYDLTIAAKWGKLEYCVARENEIDKIWQNLESGYNGIILVGPSGAGKSTVIEGVAHLMVREDVPKFLKDKRLVELDASRLISGASPAQAQARLLAVIDEVSRAGNIVLFIDNIENLIGITGGGEESLDLSEVLSGALERRVIYCFASATEDNYRRYIEGKSLGNIMAKIDVSEPEGNQAIQMIESKIGYFEGKFKVYFSYNAIEEVITLSDKYIHDKYLPQKAITILELVAVRVAKEKGEHAVISKDDIAAVISEMTGIPASKIGESESRELLNMEERIHERMINQKAAVKMVAASLRRARTELREQKRPIANFLFLGPTGVGKTELAKTVSEVYFGKEEYMIRIDMSEYQHPDSIKKMIGDASGARGYLTEAVRQAPFSLILLDEIEKAHSDILNLFLQVMDDGRLTDGQGKTIDFSNSIIIATSNAGAVFIQEQIYKGTDIEEVKRSLINDHLNKVMRPELINRFDGIIVFEPLSMDNVVEITRLMLNSIAKMLEKKGMLLRSEEAGIKKLARDGFDPKFGARPLRRLLQERIEDQIANAILAGDLKRRDTVVIDEEAKIKIEKGKQI